jgi:hypothetical protein
MNGGRIGAGRQLERLFDVGTVGGLSDSELIERFAAMDDAAFEAIVERHGPMVLRVCRMVLRDAHAAEDAFQATFPVLACVAGRTGVAVVAMTVAGRVQPGMSPRLTGPEPAGFGSPRGQTTSAILLRLLNRQRELAMPRPPTNVPVR